jgi:hypothetical protein
MRATSPTYSPRLLGGLAAGGVVAGWVPVTGDAGWGPSPCAPAGVTSMEVFR